MRHDGDDPYLVVAADKGTATFSDIANDLAIAHDFWLGDAFASGGSAGYDHKKIGITARGAWESVKRHFREMDVDIAQDAVHASSASATCRATCSATACCAKPPLSLSPLSITATFSSIPTPIREELRRAQADVRAAAVELAGFRHDADLERRRRLSAQRQGDQAGAGSADRCWASASGSPRRN